MKWQIIVFFILCAGGVVSCTSLGGNLLYYSISFRNIGNKDIDVDIFKICDSKDFSSSGCGYLYVDGEKSEGVYLVPPFEKIVIRWRKVPNAHAPRRNSKELAAFDAALSKQPYIECPVTIKLPKEFTRKNGKEINFYIDSDKRKVYVSYKIMIEPGEYKEVDSDGKPFSIKEVTGKKH